MLRRVLRENGLTIALLVAALVCIAAQCFTGFRVHQDELAQHGAAPIGFLAYLGGAHFWEALTENWESEFLQMSAYVLFTIFLRQRGAKDSKPLEGSDDVDEVEVRPDSPWPVRHGGIAAKLYASSLSIALVTLFLVSFGLHALSGARHHDHDETLHGRPAEGVIAYLGSSQFWFESMQNWQSEFLSIGVLGVFSIFLRQKGSPESKPVGTPHAETGD
jgi:hypothetical protein